MNRGTLAWRLYALGVVQLGLVALAAVLVAIRQAPPGPPHDPEGEAEIAAARLSPLLAHPVDLARELGELRDHGMAGSVYGADGALLATNIEPALAREPPGFAPPPHPWPGAPGGPLAGAPPADPLPPGSPRDRSPRHPPRPGGPPDRVLAVAMGDPSLAERPVLVARFVRPAQDLRGPLFTVGLGLLIVGVGAVLMGRWIVRPLEQLSHAARALGEGNLGSRTRLSRRDEVGEVGRAFDEMAERIQRLVHAEKELLANVSHELRTPLARIRVALDLAVEGDAQAARDAIGEIERDLAELEVILDDVLTAARMQTLDGKTSPASFALRLVDEPPETLAERAVARFRSRHPAHEVVLSVEEPLPTVRVDRVLMRRVLDNLLENAHKYAADETCPVTLHVAAAGGHVTFEVRDEGIGIAAEDLPHVFTPFFRAERSRSRGAGGVGLGLTLAKRIIEAHQGSIDVSSVPGRGTTVRVDLPIITARETIGSNRDTDAKDEGHMI